MKKSFIFMLILFLMSFPLNIKGLSYYDSNNQYTVNSLEIKKIFEEFYKEQNVVNILPSNNKAVDIVLFAGQSNMVGKGYASEANLNVKQQAGFEMRFNKRNEAAGIKYLKDSTSLKTSLIPAFANSYYNNTGTSIIAIQSAVSGSSVNDWKENSNNFKNAKKKLLETIKYVKNHPQNFKLRHIYMVWYQGEADKPTLDYEKKLTSLFNSMKKIGVEKNFLIRIGHLYKVKDKKGEHKQKDNFNKYTNMIKLQTEFCRKSDNAVLISTRAAALSLVKGPSTNNSEKLSKISDMMKDQVHFTQLALNLIGSEAGKNMAYYVNNGKEPEILDLEYKTNNNDYYYTGYDTSASLTNKQTQFFYDKAREFVRDGNKKGILQYGILSKYKAYNLQSVYYGSENYNKMKVIYMDKFKKGNYIGLDCSGFASFIYHYVYGLSFDNKGKPWSTGDYLNNPITTESGNNQKNISMFKYVGELNSSKKEYTLYSARKKFKLRTGDLIIGKNSDTDAHIVIYIGKVKSNKKDLVLNSTSASEHNIKVGNKRYNIDFAYLTEDNFDNAKNFSHKYKKVTVLRLNDNVLPSNFIGNSYKVDFSKISNKKGSYKFIPLYN